MKRAEIASLLRWGESYPADEDSVPRKVVRLIVEREVLLAALFEVIYDNRPGGGAEDRARAVLEKVRAE